MNRLALYIHTVYVESNSVISEIEIYNLDGKLLRKESDINQKTSQISVDEFMSGIYLLKLKVKGKIIEKKIEVFNNP